MGCRMDFEAISKRIVGPDKGILAADENRRSLEKRFLPTGIEATLESRRAYRELLFTTP